MERFIDDLKFGGRSLRANPTFALISILTLALGIGITTAMFTLVNKVLLQPLPFPNANQLVYVGAFNQKKNEFNSGLNIGFYDQVRQTESPLSELSFYAYDQVTLAKGDRHIPFTVLITSHNYLSMFGVEPILGRWYEESDINTQSVVISYNIWQDEFNRDPDILNRVITLDGQAFNVLGVMPQNYSNTGFTSVDFWQPINQLQRPVLMVGRLEGDLSIAQATQRSAALQRMLDQDNSDGGKTWVIKYTSVLEAIVKDTKASLYLLLASVSAVFLIAVLNVVNLTFAQYANRTQELAIRVSVGASRARLLRQLLTESALLCSIGGLLGLLLAAWSLEWIASIMGGRLPRLHEIGLDQTTLFAVLGLITFSTILTTLVPAYSIVHPSKLSEAIKQAGRKVTGDKKSQHVRRLLVSSEVCVAVVLLVCAGLLLRSYLSLANQDTGFTAKNIVTGHVWLPDNFNPQPNRSQYWLDLAEQLKADPKVVDVAATSTMPMGKTGIDYPVNYTYAGAPAVPVGEEPSASVRSITPGYFNLLDIPVTQGREFDFSDTPDSPKVVIVNKVLADKTWPGQNPVGNVLSLPAWMGGNHTVIGVVGNVKHRGLRAIPIAEFYLPVTQHNYPGMSFLVKTTGGNLGSIKNHMLNASTAMETTAPMILIETLESLTSGSIVSERLLLIVLAAFSAVALILASIGVYGISDNMVTQRTNEIGIRMAIGARPSVIRRWIIIDTSRPVLIGAVVGVILAILSGNLIASLLYGVNLADPITFVLVPFILFAVGVIATWLPARRATRIHPQQALHYD